MEPSEAVIAAESSLRTAIRLVLPDWLQARGAPTRESLIEKQEEDRKRRHGTIVDVDLLSYTEVHHLLSLILKNWEQFKPIFGDQARTKVYIEALLDYRNPVAHARELTGFERELLSGISGQLRNQVALFRMANEPSTAHYPVIEAVSDGFGKSLDTTQSYMLAAQRGLRLNLEQRLEFRCRAWDVQARPLTWFFAASQSMVDFVPPAFSIQGSRVRFSVPIRSEWVGEHVEVKIAVRTAGPYYRYPVGGGRSTPFDDVRYGTYAVNPPRPIAHGAAPHP